MATKIPWTNETWNPVVGCTKVSAGCVNCYAEKMAVRQAHMACSAKNQKPLTASQRAYTKVIKLWHDPAKERTYWKGWNGKIECIASALERPLPWRKPRKIFVCSMSDLFHPAVPFAFIERVMRVIEQCPQHTFQILTKRPQCMLEYFNGLGKQYELSCCPNLWVGTSVENQETADQRIPHLLAIPAAVRFVSAEPLLGPLDIDEHLLKFTVVNPGTMQATLKPGIDWVINGCESGPKRRPCRPGWVKSLIEQCDQAGVPVFVKQMDIGGKLSRDPGQWPEWARRQDFPAEAQRR